MLVAIKVLVFKLDISRNLERKLLSLILETSSCNSNRHGYVRDNNDFSSLVEVGLRLVQKKTQAPERLYTCTDSTQRYARYV